MNRQSEHIDKLWDKLVGEPTSIVRGTRLLVDLSFSCIEPRVQLIRSVSPGREWRNQPDRELDSLIIGSKRRIVETYVRTTHHHEVAKVGSRRIELFVPCRKCSPCRDRQSRKWRERIAAEVRESRENPLDCRQFFATFTFKPKVWDAIWATRQPAAPLTEDRYVGRDEDYLSYLARVRSDQYKSVSKSLQAELRNYWKRVRGNTASARTPRIRYVSVWELTKAGTPHVHALITEDKTETSFEPLTYNHLRSKWSQNGFINVKRIDRNDPTDRVARYLSKYLWKEGSEGLPRVNASRDYGRRFLTSEGHSLSVKKKRDATNAREKKKKVLERRPTDDTIPF